MSDAERMLSYLVHTIQNFKGGNKYLTYGELAKVTKYPKPHVGSNFGRRIGKTLGEMGHLLDNIMVPDWKGRIPYLQALVVAQNTKLPSFGLREFKTDYAELTKEKQRDYVKQEYQLIFEFGERWDIVLKELGIKKFDKSTPQTNRKFFNPFGSEGSPEHRELRDYVASNSKVIGLNHSFESVIEYPLKSGDSVDVVLYDENKVWGVEVKSRRSGEDDLERGIYQCIKYREVLKAEDKTNNFNRIIDCILVHEEELSRKLARLSKKLRVLTKQISFNKQAN